MFESIIKDIVLSYLDRFDLIRESQHGFVKKRSCPTTQLSFYEQVSDWIDTGTPVYVIFLDFKKAFNRVPHRRLLLKLKAYGIDDKRIN